MPQLAETPRVVFTPSGRRGVAEPHDTVLDVARRLGVDLDSVCGGRAICGRCQVAPVSGEFPAHHMTSGPDHLGPVTADEEAYRDRRGLEGGRRLGCAARVLDDVVIDVPPESRLHRQVVRKRVEVDDVTIDPVIRPYYVAVEPPTLERSAGDVQRLLAALDAEWGLGELDVDADAVGDVQRAITEGKGAVTAAVRDGRRLATAWPGFHDRILGVAFDVGSTTIAGTLCDLASGEVLADAGVMNPQIRFGEDLMSRVSYVMMHPDGAADLTTAVRDALDELVGVLVADAGVGREDVLELTVVGNPIMHHLVFGLDVRPLGEAPFPLATSDSLDEPASALGIRTHRAARVHALPCIAGHVGADAAAVILSEAPHRSDRIRLVVDVGTNAEIVLGSRDRLLAASSPTGPAFEGAQISSGQRAARGAIERVRIDRDTLEPTVRVIGSDEWSRTPGAEGISPTGICGSGIIEATAELYLTGLVTPDGRFADDAHLKTDRIRRHGRTASYALTDSIEITQADVRAIQLAKAALYAGARLLMDHLGVERVDEIRLAGAFGSHIDPFYAMVLGLIPDCDLAGVTAAGNAAGAGAMIALLDGSARAEIRSVVREVEKVETATEPRFQEHFVDAMAFPHRSDPFPSLGEVVDLPGTRGEEKPRRRRRRN